MTYITIILKDGEAYAGPEIQAFSWEEAEHQAITFPYCQVTGVLDSVYAQSPV